MKTVHTLLAASLLAVSFGASAATNLAVTGTIKPVSCTMNLEGGGAYDMGKISRGSLNANSFTAYPVQDRKLEIDCGTAGVPVSLSLTDNQAGTSAFSDDANYGLGFGSDGVTRLGSYAFYTGHETMDGGPVKIGSAPRGTNPVTWGTNNYFRTGNWLTAVDDTNHVLPVTHLEFSLRFKFTLDATNKFPTDLLSTEQTFAGSSTLTLNYL